MHLEQKKINILLPYLRIRNAINKSGELYFKASEIASDKSINDYNEYLVEWEQDQGYSIVNDSGLVTISAYETITLKILQRLLDFTQAGIKGQKRTKRTIYKRSFSTLTRLMFPSKKQLNMLLLIQEYC